MYRNECKHLAEATLHAGGVSKYCCFLGKVIVLLSSYA